MKKLSLLLSVVLFLAGFNPLALAGRLLVPASPCGASEKIYLPLIIDNANAMAQQSITEQLESIIRDYAAYPYDGRITQVYANTVNVKLNGSRTIVRDVALPEHIKSDDLAPGMAVRLVQTVGKPTVVAVYEQFNDPEMFNYAGIGSRVPATPTVTVKATKNGWLVTWNAVTGATKYILYKNDTPNEDSPEEVAQMGAAQPSYTVEYDENGLFRYFAVKACSGLLESEVSLWLTDQTPPAAPAWKAHTYLPLGHYLEWTHPDAVDVKEFIIYRNTSAAGEGAIEVTRTPNLNTLVDYTTEGDWFGVQAVDWSDLNRSAIVWTGQAYDPTPAIPAPVANMVENGGFVVNWPAVVGPPPAGGYEVQSAGDTSDPETYASEWSGQALTSPVIAKAGVSRFRVRAQGYDLSWSGWSDWKTDTNPPPKPIVAVSGASNAVTIELAIADTSHSAIGFSHYVLEQADGPNGENAVILDTHAAYPSFPRTIGGLLKGVTKYWRLTPYDWAGNAGPPSNWTPGTPVWDGQTLQDRFDGYGGSTLTPLESLWWLSLAKVEQSENWTLSPTNLATWVSTPIVGAKAIRLVGNTPGLSTSASLAKVMNLNQDGRFTNDDYIVIQATFAGYGDQHITITFYNTPYPSGSGYKCSIYIYGGGDADLTFPIYLKRSQFVAYGSSPDWTTIQGVQIYVENYDLYSNLDMTIDDIRIVKADPDHAAAYNDTGKNWDYTVSNDTDTGEWHIYAGNCTSEPGKPFSFGQVNHLATPDRWYMAYKPEVDISSGTIQAGVFHKENGTSGLAFFVKDTTPGQWTMYAIEANNVSDTVKLVRWVDGVRVELGSASFSFISAAGGAAGRSIWLGADFYGYEADGRIKVYASLTEGNLIQAANLKLSIQDTEVGSGGTVGLLSYQANVRFMNFTAGSPAHAEVADVALALDGPVIAGETKRLVYDETNNRWAHTSDGGGTLTPLDANNAAQLGGVAAANYLQRTSANRPGVTRLYRRDNDSNYNVQVHHDGSRWFLRGYNGDTFHAECRVAYADTAGSATTATTANGINYGCFLTRNASWTPPTANAFNTVPFTEYYWNTMGSCWDSSTAIYAQRTGWHLAFGGFEANATTTQTALRFLKNGTEFMRARDWGNWNRYPSINAACPVYMTAGEYVQMAIFMIAPVLIQNNTPWGIHFGLICL